MACTSCGGRRRTSRPANGDPAALGGSTDVNTLVTVEFLGNHGDLPYKGPYTHQTYYFGVPMNVRRNIPIADAEALVRVQPQRFRIVAAPTPAPAPAPVGAPAAPAAPPLASQPYAGTPLAAGNPLGANIAAVMEANGIALTPEGKVIDLRGNENPVAAEPPAAEVHPAGSEQWPQAKAEDDAPPPGVPDVSAFSLPQIKEMTLDKPTAATMLADEMNGRARKGVLSYLQQLAEDE